MEQTRRIILTLCLVATAWAATPRVALVVGVRGHAAVVQNGRQRPLRTLQVLPEQARIVVDRGAQLRMTYFASARKETVSGPVQLVTGRDGSLKKIGAGKLVVEEATGARTMVPKSDNLRRMGGTIHAMQDMDALALLDRIPTAPIQGIQRRAKRLTINPLSPSLSQAPDDLGWSGGKPPYKARLLDAAGKVVAQTSSTDKTALAISAAPGAMYLLQVEDSEGTSMQTEFYVLSPDERAEVELDLGQIEQETGAGTVETLTQQIAYLEQRGLLQQALPLARAAIQSAPDDVGLHLALGRLQVRLGQLKAAEETLNRALELEKDER